MPIALTGWARMRAADPGYYGPWRRAYIELASRIVSGLGLREGPQVLEVGPHVCPLVMHCHTLDIREQLRPTYLHDARTAPWPMPNGAYELAIALQVWEHLAGRQQPAFRELRRVSRRALLSYPYRWPPTTETGWRADHAGLDERHYRRWTAPYRPARHWVVGEVGAQRKLELFDWTQESAAGE